eukprot:TRINITY_DN4066_c0_g1_i1.p1 TRINITY_DN4066_c0_g1~~TRINITY_DN4066_c0_g1_i1.p1  ORF type:complete len:218 (-),score=23.16 TRINITY_DN4066_c0_g1_i1:198-851(-)
MLLVCGPVSRQHFYFAGGCTGVGAIVLVVGQVIDGLPRYVSFFGAILAIVGTIQGLLFFTMLNMYGWRSSEGAGSIVVWTCQHCAARFPTFEAAAVHEQSCVYGSNVDVPVGGATTIIGMPMGQVVQAGGVRQAVASGEDVPLGAVSQFTNALVTIVWNPAFSRDRTEFICCAHGVMVRMLIIVRWCSNLALHLRAKSPNHRFYPWDASFDALQLLS